MLLRIISYHCGSLDALVPFKMEVEYIRWNSALLRRRKRRCLLRRIEEKTEDT